MAIQWQVTAHASSACACACLLAVLTCRLLANELMLMAWLQSIEEDRAHVQDSSSCRYMCTSSVWNKPELWEDRRTMWVGNFIKHGLVVVHIPKTGGTSVVSAIFAGEKRSQHYSASFFPKRGYSYSYITS